MHSFSELSILTSLAKGREGERERDREGDRERQREREVLSLVFFFLPRRERKND